MIHNAFRPKLLLVPKPKATGPAPAKAAESSPIAVLFGAAGTDPRSWLRLSMEEKITAAQRLIDEGRTSLAEAAMVRRIMDAYALAFTAAQRALA